MKSTKQERINVLGVGINATSPEDAVSRLLEARRRGERGYVCVTSVHGVMESQCDPELRCIHNNSLMTVPDGMPTVWMGQEYGFTEMRRVYGPDLMLAVCEQSVENGPSGLVESRSKSLKDGAAPLVESRSKGSLKVVEGRLKSLNGEDGPQTTDNRQQATGNKSFTHFLYGATAEKLAKLKANLEEWCPGILIAGTYAPPFRPLSDEEERELQSIVAECKPDFFWVGLSTPKQERFMAEHGATPLVEDGPSGLVENRSKSLKTVENGALPLVENGSKSLKGVGRRLKALNGKHGPQVKYPLDVGIMIGVGAAFDIHSGMMKDAPQWIKNAGLQWFYRLCCEPRRLWRRYLWIVPGFLWLAFLQVMGLRRWEIDGPAGLVKNGADAHR